MSLLAELDVGALVELVWFAPLAAVAVTISFSTCVLGAARSSDARRDGQSTASFAWLVLAILAGLLVTAEVVAGIAVIVWG